MAYFVSVSPPLLNQRTLEAYFELLCEISVTEAYHFCQRQPSQSQKRLFDRLLVSVHSEVAGEERADRALELISLPFTAEEEKLFEACLLHGPGSRCVGGKDSVIIRRIALGRNLDALHEVERWQGQRINGMSWDDVKSSLHKAAMT